MSLGEGLDDVNLLDSAADKMDQNVKPRYQLMIINDEQHLIHDDQGREIHSVSDESACSKYMLFYNFVIKSWLCQTTSNKQLKD